jgi:hypothetical protein
MGPITIEKGAEIKSASQGRVMILAPEIENRGTIETPDGQTILAASKDKVYIKASDDNPSLRGLLVEVETGGDVRNVGKIVAERGNISLVGLAVNQDGLARATTSVRANGSIRLMARDRANVVNIDGDNVPIASRTGKVTLGKGSVTEVLPELDDKTTAVDEQGQATSRVEVMSRTVHLKEKSRITAPGGQVTVTATLDPLFPVLPNTPENHTRVVMEKGSQIDVAGTDSTVLPADRNLVSVELRSNELRDAPLQRDGVLRGQTIVVDRREGTPLADVTGALANTQRTVGERLAMGGTVSVKSEGDVILKPGSTVDFSGGQVTYAAGQITTTKLISDGRIVDISEADPNRRYDGIFGSYTRRHLKWGVSETFNVLGSGALGEFSPSYVEGKDAGTFEVAAPGLALAGTLLGRRVTGQFQRHASVDIAAGTPAFGREFDELPLGGKLVIGAAAQADVSGGDLRTPDVNIVNSGGGSTSPGQVSLNTRTLENSGVGRLAIYSNGHITLDGDVDLSLPGDGEVAFVGGSVDIQGKLSTAGGEVSLKAQATPEIIGDNTLMLGRSARIDTSGQWTNDNPVLHDAPPTEQILPDGGAVELFAAGNIDLKKGNVIDVGGGGWLDANGKLTPGKAGGIGIATRVLGGSGITLGGTLLGYAMEDSGTLSLEANAIRLQGSNIANKPGELALTPAFFQTGGFAHYDLTANRSSMILAAGTVLEPRVENRVLDSGYQLKPTGSGIETFSHVELLPRHQREPAGLSLTLAQKADSFEPGVFVIEKGAHIKTDPGARVDLTSDNRILVQGRIDTPAGEINLHLTNPVGGFDPGYRAGQSIWLGPDSQLAAKAVAQLTPNPQGLRQGEVRPGGAVSLNAERGYVVAESGSLIDVSGVSEPLDLPAATPGTIAARTVQGDAGSIRVTAAEGMLLDGDLKGQPAGTGGAGGDLHLGLDANNRGDLGTQGFLYRPREIHLLGEAGNALPSGLEFGDNISAAINGQARIRAGAIAEGGFDSLSLLARNIVDFSSTLRSTGAVVFDGNTNLDLTRSITLDASTIATGGYAVQLDAAHVALGSTDLISQAGRKAAGGPGRLSVSADLIDLAGATRVRGADHVTLRSEGDIRLTGVQGRELPEDIVGSFTVFKDLELKADQIYPTTLTQFSLAVRGDPNGTLSILPGSGESAVLSAGGRLSLQAPNIVQRGVVKAPLGNIDFEAGNSLRLAPGSLTSTSAQGQTIPFGRTEAGADWVFPLTFLNLVLEKPPEKRIQLQGKSVAINKGAVVDASGGGDLLAYEFIPGPGGSRDILAPENASGAFAVIPGFQSEYAPIDPLESRNFPYRAGDSVYLSGAGGLPEGEYAVLPARYALLPGGFLITPEQGYQDIRPGEPQFRLDGSPIAAGRFTVAGTAIKDSRTRGFAIETGSTAKTRAEYAVALANDFFPKRAAANDLPTPLLPKDAGRLALSAAKKLDLGGKFRSQAEDQGRGGQVDIEAERIAIGRGSSPEPGFVRIDARELNQLGAASLLLGGSRAEQAGTTRITTQAEEIRVERGASLNAPEILLTAKDRVTVEGGAKLTASGKVSSSSGMLALAGNSAFARVSAGEQARVERGANAGGAGLLRLARGSILRADGSMTLDAGLDIQLDGQLLLRDGSLAIGTSRISLGEVTGNEPGLAISNADLDRLDASELILASADTIDLIGGLDLSLDRLAIDAPGLRGRANRGQTARVTADKLTLGNHGETTPNADSGRAQGELDLQAGEVILGPGPFAIQGFGHVAIEGAKSITGQSKGELDVAGSLTLTATWLTAASGADLDIEARGSVNIGAPEKLAALPDAESLGAHLAITGARINLQGNIVLPAGSLNLRATRGDVTLATGSSIDAAGRSILFGDVTVAAPAGAVSLLSDKGDVLMENGSILDVSGGPRGGAAGRLNLSATVGQIKLSGTLKATAAKGFAGGSVDLDVRRLANLGDAGQQFTAAGFTEGQGFRVRAGDLAIGSGETLAAHSVRLSADSGKVTVAGKIDSAGQDGGEVIISARDGLMLAETGAIDASASSKGETGGRVELRTVSTELDLRSGSVIDVSAGQGGETGHVHLRAPRTGQGVAVAALDSRIQGAGAVDLEAFRVYSAGTINEGLIGAIRGDTESFMAGAAAIEASLGKGGDPRFHLLPGVEIAGAGDLSLVNAWDLAGWRFGGEPGVLTLRAGGDLNVNTRLSDGFAPALVSGKTLPDRLLTGHSWSYRLTAGADLASADPLAIIAGAGDIDLAATAKVRTGAGNINVAAGGDLILDGASSAIYSAGRATAKDPYGSFPDSFIARRFPAQYPIDGGDIHIRTGGGIQGAPVNQPASDWLRRLGDWNPDNTSHIGETPTAWGIAFENFGQGIGAFGGGDVSILAGGDVQNLTVVLPTTGKQTGRMLDESDDLFASNVVEVLGGGDLALRAGGDVLGGLYLVGRGQGAISAAGAIQPASQGALGTLLALGEGGMDVLANTGIHVETVFNPTVSPRSKRELDSTGAEGFYPSFFTYADTSAVRLTALSGDVTLQNDPDRIAVVTNLADSNPDALAIPALTVYPGALEASALTGDVRIDRSFTLFPSTQGGLRLFAEGDITTGHHDATVQVNLSDTDPRLLPGIDRPQGSYTEAFTRLVALGPSDLLHAPEPLHRDDPEPSRLVAKHGGIMPNDRLLLVSAEETRLLAGRDIRDIELRVQHTQADDVTIVQAGRDIAYSTQRNERGRILGNQNRIEVAGPGELQVVAGRHIQLGASEGIKTIGDQINPALANAGANMTVVVGAAPDRGHQAFIDRYLVKSKVYRKDLLAYMRGLTGNSLLTADPALKTFQRLPAQRQREFILKVFFSEIQASGLQGVKGKGFQRGFTAIKTLFPGKQPLGDINMVFSTIRTQDGGDIRMLVPGGKVDVGLAAVLEDSKPPSELGIVVQGQGDISAFLRDDFLVNQSRVFALDGGDILVWSSKGDIDAGRGAKTAIVAPPPVVTIDGNGNVAVEFPPAVSGSGIRGAVTSPGKKPGDVFLFAPEGIVNAGDAGIGSAGNLTIAAVAVVGADNIQVGGASSGVPAVQTGGLAAGLTGVSNAAASATQAANDPSSQKDRDQDARNAMKDALSFLDVEVIGFGDDSEEEDDEEN